ncbi:MAG: type I-E CRISPR-associated protein Cas5/CasD [Desulfovibrionaceae bacterium]|jgi:CRISPR system Cascade subunit CasD|nr:type I-E CRISPR-associated protein Cas5/CasD [Desulfovibrionaceae bacterium]
MEHVLFQLYGPLASWGSVAVNVIRDSWDRPSKTAVLGLVAGALGIDRADEAAHRALHAQWGFAVRVDAPGVPVTDFHTVQTPAGKWAGRCRTRRDELVDMRPESAALSTTVSQRTYLQDALFTVCLWPVVAATERTPVELAAALNAPAFIPYLGRRSCPAALPLGPQIREADTVLEALAGYGCPQLLSRLCPGRGVPCDVYVEDGWVEAPETVFRHDALASRAAWQFKRRAEAHLRAPAPGMREQGGE